MAKIWTIRILQQVWVHFLQGRCASPGLYPPPPNTKKCHWARTETRARYVVRGADARARQRNRADNIGGQSCRRACRIPPIVTDSTTP
eukprot:5806733-Pyramimonas_sp.AAC.1